MSLLFLMSVFSENFIHDIKTSFAECVPCFLNKEFRPICSQFQKFMY